MYSRIIKYEDYNGVEKEKEFLFHLNKAECIKLVTATEGDYTLDKMVDQLIKEHNGKEIIKIFDNLIKMSYGVKSVDGERFIKSEEITDAFVQSEAYSVLFSELVTDAKKAAEFFNGIIPKKMADDINKIMAENPDAIPDNLKDYMPGITPPAAGTTMPIPFDGSQQ